ncbi:HAD-like domain-containing protein [Mycena pura]|uniref:HAD-like domain-containing protein n=1 Tax=Mycena pura TaxID=153505 RepID=A0AAD6V7W3_9AGAR|nr:HAD-like domain-containing protein [Mycena pura]
MAGLRNVHALLFDVFGTTVDWHASLIQELTALGETHGVGTGVYIPSFTYADWSAFSKTWRRGYMNHIQNIASGGVGTTNMDEMHREILEHMLKSPEWKNFGALLGEGERTTLNNAWHRLHGWPDATDGISALKKNVLVVALSNGNMRMLIDLAKFAHLPWDAIFSSELFGSFKPDPKVYQGAMKHLSLAPENCAMVAAHMWDLRGAARAGMKTIYVRRAAEEPTGEDPDMQIKAKSQGGEVDLVVDSFAELTALFEGGR